jgi:hypothetical protein
VQTIYTVKGDFKKVFFKEFKLNQLIFAEMQKNCVLLISTDPSLVSFSRSGPELKQTPGHSF